MTYGAPDSPSAPVRENYASRIARRLSPARPFGSFTPLGLVVLTALSAWLGYRTFARGDDFLVFYRTSIDFFRGVSPYDLGRHGNMVFKYPPWILPIFLPLAALPLAAARAFYVALQAAALFDITRRLRDQHGASERVLLFSWILFIPLLLIQAMVGQLSLFLVHFALVLAGEGGRSNRQTLRLHAWHLVAFSVKVLSLFPFLAFVLPDRRRRERPTNGSYLRQIGTAIPIALLLAAALSLPLLLQYRGNVGALVTDWIHAMFSGTRDIDSVRIGFTTREAQGLPSLFLRLTGADESDPSNVVGAVAVAFGLLAAIAALSARGLAFAHRLFLCLALTPLLQPLAWFHFYLFVYPAFALTLDRAWTRRNEFRGRRIRLALVLASGLLLVGITEKTLGTFGRALELAGVKTWATLAIVALFTLAFRERERVRH